MEIWYDENGELNLTPTPKLPRIRSGVRPCVGCGSAGGPEEAEANIYRQTSIHVYGLAQAGLVAQVGLTQAGLVAYAGLAFGGTLV